VSQKQPPHPRHYYAKDNEPPNRRVRIEMFLLACEDYGNLQRAFPLPDLPVQYTGAISDQFYWVVMLHAAVLRKFFSSRDQTELHKVIDAARGKVVDHADRARVEANLDLVEQFAPFDKVPSRLAENWPNGDVVPVWEKVIIELYGRHLHSDFGKWHASKRFPDRAILAPMYEWCRAATESVKAVELAIRDGEASGVIDLEDDHQQYWLPNGELNRED
jgi:hypothetical protein